MAATVAIVDDTTVQRERLLTRLGYQREHLAMLWSWYRGTQDLPEVPHKYRPAYQLMLNSSITPWARLVVDAIAERLRVQGVRSVGNPEAAADAWTAFTRSRLNADQRLIYTEALIGGTSYASVSEPEEAGEAVVAPESAFEVTHENDPGNRRTVAGALKLYPLDWERMQWVCELYRPEATYRWITETDAPRTLGEFPIDNPGRRKSRADLTWDALGVQENPTGVVPVVPFENRVDVLSGGASEIEDCIPILQRIDRTTLDRLLASHYSSFRQKWATGIEVPTDPETGKPVEPYKLAVDRLWVNESPDGRFGTFEASDVGQYLSATDSDIAALAAISRVPAHYLMQRNLANPPSAESLIAGETGLVAKVEDRQAQYGESWERVLWLQAQMSGRALDVEQLEMQWQDAEKRNPAQVADAAVKLQDIGVPQQALWAYIGATPQQIAEWTVAEAAAQLLAAAAQPQPPPTGVAGAAG
jgi:hypothetical protein